MMHGQAITDNEIYLLIKYIKSVLWRVAKRLSYTEDARCLKVNLKKPAERKQGPATFYTAFRLARSAAATAMRLITLALVPR